MTSVDILIANTGGLREGPGPGASITRFDRKT